jgi:Asp-tRNA(Asn)/Glu-tRNA(Gln) amidotransferase A subunit family amidase
MVNLNKLPAVEAAEGIREKKFTAEELMRDCLERISIRENSIQAWAYINPDYALDRAKQADRHQNDGKSLGPLHGLPIGVKDVIDTEDMPTENGSPINEGRRPQKDALCVAALRRAGAIILGKTVTTELANINPSKTRNPHNIEYSPGGSSAGSGAGVADYHMPLALGTQTGGSVIRPASFNGIYGLKPTLGIIPRDGVLLQSHTLDTIGVYGRTLEDLAFISDTISVSDPDDAQSYKGSRSLLWPQHMQVPTHTPTFGFFKTPAWSEAHPAAQEAIIKVTKILGNKCRNGVLPAPFDDIINLHATVFSAENAHYYGSYLKNKSHLLSKNLHRRLESTKDILARDYIAALEAKDIIYKSVEKFLDDHDAILCLAAPGPAPHGFETTGSAIFNGLWTYLGVPCISLPLLTVEDMPLGLQLVGKRGEEGKLFQNAKWLEKFLYGKVL